MAWLDGTLQYWNLLGAKTRAVFRAGTPYGWANLPNDSCCNAQKLLRVRAVGVKNFNKRSSIPWISRVAS